MNTRGETIFKGAARDLATCQLHARNHLINTEVSAHQHLVDKKNNTFLLQIDWFHCESALRCVPARHDWIQRSINTLL